MRVLVLTSSYPRYPGDGAAPFVRSISEGLARLGHAVMVLAPYDCEVLEAPPPSSADSELRIQRFRYAPLKSWHIMGHARSLRGDMALRMAAVLLAPVFVFFYLMAGLAAIRRHRPDVIHAHWVVPSGFIAACLSSLTGIPFVVSLHGSDVFLSLRTKVLRLCAGWALRRARAVTACSDGLKSGAVELGAKPSKVSVLAWGADPTRFSPGVKPADRTKYGLRGDELAILALGRIVPKKGFDVLIEAVATLAETDPHVALVIGGHGVQHQDLVDLSARLGISDRVRFADRIPWNEVPAFLNMGDVFALPSIPDPSGNVDGLPTVLLEAMALGMPVVASDIAGVPLVIQHGVSGILCPPGDSQQLADALGVVLGSSQLRDRLGRSARAAVVARYNWTEVARALSGLFADASHTVQRG